MITKLPEGRYDDHLHVMPGDPDSAEFFRRMQEAGIAGGAVFSEDPDPAGTLAPVPPPPEVCMDKAIAWCEASETLFPFYWINPVAPGAEDLVDMAVEKGMYGFKVLPGTFMPGDDRAIPVYRKIAKYNKPVIFHSGILWDGRDFAKYTRPGNYEALIQVPRLRFALAHISWPWCEECIAVFGKLLNARSMWGDEAPEMFIDLTPGTPPILRRNPLTMLFTIGYDIKDRIMFGTDCMVNDYGTDYALSWQKRDDAIYDELGLGADVRDSVYRRAFEYFLFGSDGDPAKKKIPVPGQD